MNTTTAELAASTARRTLTIEADALTQLADSIGEAFTRCVLRLHQGKGRIIATGIGKTALVAQKIVATLNSTGTPSLFLHAGDAIHGDIGMVQPEDALLVLSRSGETAEIRVLSALVRTLGNPLIAMTSRADSTLAHRADYLLHVPFEREADPNELAPTTSTTLMMAMGDALATSLLALRGFSPSDFARFHPGGTLGKQLYLRVSDIYPHNQRPLISADAPLRDVLNEITSSCLGATAVATPGTEQVVGIITDGDLRRLLNQRTDLERVSAADMMSAAPKQVESNTLAVDAVALMQDHSISQLIVVEEQAYVGMVHLHDFVREGLV